MCEYANPISKTSPIKLPNMKKLFLPISLLFAFILTSFVASQPLEEVENYELKQQDSIAFTNGPQVRKEKIRIALSRGANDKSSYSIKLADGGVLTISDLKACKGLAQSKLELFLCSGYFSRKADTIIVHTKTIFDKLYMVNVKEWGRIDSFSSEATISIISKTLKNEYCPSLLTINSWVNLIAIPQNVNPKEVWKARHKAKTVGVFTYLNITDAQGKTKSYPQGDYILIGGNRVE